MLSERNSFICRGLTLCSNSAPNSSVWVFSWHQLGVLQFNSIWHYLPGDSIRFHRLRAQSHKTAPHFRCQSQVQVCFWPTGYKSEVPIIPSLGSINLPEQLIELPKPVYSLDYQFFFKSMIKNMNPQPDKEIHRARSWTKKLLTLWNLGSNMAAVDEFWSTNLKALQVPSFWVFMVASNHRHDQLNHWWLIQLLASLSTTEISGSESSNPLITWLFPLATAPIFRCSSNLHHYQKTPWLLSALITGNSKGLRAMDQEWEKNPNIYFLWQITRSHTLKQSNEPNNIVRNRVKNHIIMTGYNIL